MVNSKIWGKTLKIQENDVYYPLLGHMLDTATVAGIIWDNWLKSELKSIIEESLGSNAKSFLQFAAGIHDLGKCSPVFQAQMLAGKHSRPEIQELLESDGFIFPEIDNVKSARLDSLHRHEKLGAYSISRDTKRSKELGSDCWLELALLGHHGQFKLSYGNRRNPQDDILESIINKSWTNEQALLIEKLEESLGVSLEEAYEKTGVRDEVIILISGLIVLADRVASTDKSVQKAHDQLESGELSLDEAADWLQVREGFLKVLVSEEIGFPVDLSVKDILGDYTPRGIQENFPKDDGLWICMAPTGAGKTEAALLRHREKKERLIFLLPTLSTTNAMMGRLLETYKNKEKTTAVLGHGLAKLEDFYTNQRRDFLDREDSDDCGLVPTGFSSVSGAKLSASINVATIDQLLMGAFPIKFSPLRWLLIANSHVVIDEAHLLDHYQVELLSPILNFLGKLGSRVSILSATLPNWLENKITKSYSYGIADKVDKTIFPSSVLVKTNFQRELDSSIAVEAYSATVEIERSTDSIGDHVSWVMQSLEKHPRARVGVFVNQVKRAQTIALELRRELPSDVTIICLHSRMLAKHRKNITDYLLKNLRTKTGKLERVVLVGTQVIEMSLDIDLDLVTTDLCPAPSLIQRMGRSWRDKSSFERFERIPKSEFLNMQIRIGIPIDNEEEMKFKELLPYRESVLKRTANFLEGRDKLNFPGDLQGFVETVMLNPDSFEGKAEEEEYADTIYKTMRGKDVAIDTEFLFRDYEGLTVQQYGPTLTDSNQIDEDMATRLVEGPNAEPFVVMSSDPSLQELGALKSDTELLGTHYSVAQLATVSLSMRMSNLLNKDETIEKMKIDGARVLGYFGELPEYLIYDELTGLTEI